MSYSHSVHMVCCSSEHQMLSCISLQSWGAAISAVFVQLLSAMEFPKEMSQLCSMIRPEKKGLETTVLPWVFCFNIVSSWGYCCSVIALRDLCGVGWFISKSPLQRMFFLMFLRNTRTEIPLTITLLLIQSSIWVRLLFPPFRLAGSRAHCWHRFLKYR